jgi:hypothetical protein
MVCGCTLVFVVGLVGLVFAEMLQFVGGEVCWGGLFWGWICLGVVFWGFLDVWLCTV